MRYYIIISIQLFSFVGQSQDLVSGGLNSWILHTPDDGRTEMYVAPFVSGGWAWDQSTLFYNNGGVKFSGQVDIGTGKLNLLPNGWNSIPTEFINYVSFNHPGLSEDFIGYKGNAFYFLDVPGGGDVIDPNVIVGGSLGLGTTNLNSKLTLALQNPSGWNGNKKALRVLSPDNTYYLDVDTYVVASGNVGYHFNPNGNSGLVITTPGNVGIGTTAPDSKLTVKGDIHTREVKVDLAGAVGPDYVFEKDYSLTSLEELKSYIDENKHLPEIPSAKEMEEEGINLKEMNLLLLRKIEEMTLHLIQQNEQIAHLKEDSRVSADSSAKKVEELTLHLIQKEEVVNSLKAGAEVLEKKVEDLVSQMSILSGELVEVKSKHQNSIKRK